jgi:hypothetical protein
MRPERVAALFLVAALLLAALAPAVAGNGGPPEHSSAPEKAIEAAKKPNNPGGGPNNGKDESTPEPTPTAVPTPEPTVTPAATPTALPSPEPTATPVPTETVPDPDEDGSPWTGILLALLLVGAGAALGMYLKRPQEEVPPTVLADANRTMLPVHPPGFPAELAGRYDRVAFVGRGGLGQVFSAVRRDDGRTVAVKIPVSYDEATGKTFMREMRFQEDLVHENIVRVHSVNILPLPFVEMEYLPRSLADLDKPVPLAEALRIAAGIAAGIAYAHERGIVHRDIKPGNILLADDLTPKIADWGMSTRPAETRETAAAGFTLAYAAPEQIAPDRFGRAGPATDIYQLGAVLYEMATGKPPHAGEGIAGMAGAVLDAEPVPPSAIDPALAGLDEVILRCLAKTPADRYRSAGDLLGALEALMREGA